MGVFSLIACSVGLIGHRLFMFSSLNFNKALFTKVLLVIILVAFAIVGIASGVNKSQKSDVAIIKVGRVRVSQRDFQRAYAREIGRIKQVAGPSISDEDINRLGLQSHIVKDLEDQALVLNFIHDLGLRLPNSLVYDSIRDNPMFQDDNGSFDESKFFELLGSNGYTESAYLKRLSDALIHSSFMSVIGRQAFPIDYVAQELYARRFQARVADFVILNNNAIKVSKKFSDAELAKVHEERKQDYYSPERRKVRYVSIGTDNVRSRITISDDEVADIAKGRLAQEKERYDFSNVVFDSYTEALKFYELVSSNGSSFKSKAEKSRGFVSYMRAVDKGSIPNEFALPLFKIREEGGVTTPFNTMYGWHVAKLEKKYLLSESDMVEEVKAGLIEEKASEELYGAIARIEDDRRRGALLDDIAKDHALKIVETGYFAFSDADGVEGDFPPASPLLVAQAAFMQNKGSKQSDFLFDSTNGVYLLVEVVDIANPVRLPFSDVKEQIRAQLKQDSDMTQLREIAEKAKQMVVDSADFHEGARTVAKQYGGVYIPNKVVHRPDAMARMDMVTYDYPVELIEGIFSASKSGEATAVVAHGDSAVIFAVFSESRDAPSTPRASHLSMIKDEITKGYRDTVYTGMVDFLRNKYKVTTSLK